MKKILICLVLVLVGLSASPVMINAEDSFDSDETYEVVFTKDNTIIYRYNGEEVSEEELALNLADIQPDDSIRRVYTLKNESTETIDWYMKNTSDAFENPGDQTMDDGVISKGAVYEYTLTYSNYVPAEDGKTIYSSNVVGGMKMDEESINNIPQGIEEATEGLEDYFLLQEGFTSSDSEHVTLTLVIDGVSSEFVYQGSDANVAVKFAVVIPPKSTERHEERVIYIPYTGDTMNLNFYIIGEFLSLILLAVVLYAYYRYLKRQREA